MKKAHIYIIVALIIFIILRLPSFFEPHWYGDEGIYASIAYALENGRALYSQAWDNKPPGIYWLYSLGETDNRLLFIRSFSLIAGIFSIILIYKIAKMLKLKKNAVATTVMTAVFLLGTPIWEGNIANAENFFLPFILASFILALRQNRADTFIGGILMGLALLFKFHPIFDAMALVLFLAITPWGSLKEKLQHLIIFLAGTALPLFSTALYFVYSQSWQAAMSAIFTDTLSYATFYNTTFIKSAIKFGGVFIAILMLTFFYFRKKISGPVYLITLLLTFEFFGALLSGRPYQHYLLQIIPSLSLYAGTMVSFMLSRKHFVHKLSIFIISLLLLSGFFLIFYQGEGTILDTNPIRYYKTFASYISNNQRQYFLNDADQKITLIDKSLERYQTRSIYFYSNTAWLYDRLKIVPPTQFIVVYHRFLIKDGQTLLIAQLKSSKPDIIALDREEIISENLQEFLENAYKIDFEDNYFDYYIKS